MVGTPGANPEYVFGNSWQHEDERLRSMEAGWDPHSIRRAGDTAPAPAPTPAPTPAPAPAPRAQRQQRAERQGRHLLLEARHLLPEAAAAPAMDCSRWPGSVPDDASGTCADASAEE